MKKFITFFCTCFLAFCTLTGCGSNEKYIGTYTCVEYVEDGVVGTFNSTIELKKDNVFNYYAEGDIIEGTYKIKGDKITVGPTGHPDKEMTGTIKDGKIIIENESLRLVFEKVNGKYNFTVIKINGVDVSYLYEYYYIELKDGGKCVIAAKVANGGISAKAEATYEVKDGKIYIYSKMNGINVTEEYVYTNGTIIMDAYIDSDRFYAILKK